MASPHKTKFRAGLSVMALAMIANIWFSDYCGALRIALSMQVTATGALFFGLLKAHPAHKSKFLLFWLGVSALFLTTLVYTIQTYFVRNFNFSNFDEYVVMVCSTASAAGIAYLMNIIYKGYVELTEEPVEPLVAAVAVEPVVAVETVETVKNVETVETVAEDKPPTYETSIKNVSISMDS